MRQVLLQSATGITKCDDYYKVRQYNVPPHRVGFLRRFGLKTGINFAHFGLESGVVFEGTTECMNVFIVLIPNE